MSISDFPFVYIGCAIATGRALNTDTRDEEVSMKDGGALCAKREDVWGNSCEEELACEGLEEIIPIKDMWGEKWGTLEETNTWVGEDIVTVGAETTNESELIEEDWERKRKHTFSKDNMLCSVDLAKGPF